MLLPACVRLFTLLPELFGSLLSTEVALKLVSDLSGCVQMPGVSFTSLLREGEGSREIARHLHGFGHIP